MVPVPRTSPYPIPLRVVASSSYHLRMKTTQKQLKQLQYPLYMVLLIHHSIPYQLSFSGGSGTATWYQQFSQMGPHLFLQPSSCITSPGRWMIIPGFFCLRWKVVNCDFCMILCQLFTVIEWTRGKNKTRRGSKWKNTSNFARYPDGCVSVWETEFVSIRWGFSNARSPNFTSTFKKLEVPTFHLSSSPPPTPAWNLNMRMASEALLRMDTCIMSHGSVQANKGQAMRLQFLVKNRAGTWSLSMMYGMYLVNIEWWPK